MGKELRCAGEEVLGGDQKIQAKVTESQHDAKTTPHMQLRINASTSKDNRHTWVEPAKPPCHFPLVVNSSILVWVCILYVPETHTMPNPHNCTHPASAPSA